MKFSIVTPIYNGEKYIAETIESVLSQEGDFEIEYIIQDGQSIDNTLSIIKSYDEKLRIGIFPIKCNDVTLNWYSEKDTGMYDAINKGFARASGDIFAWINCDDFFSPAAFSKISQVFMAYPEVLWLKGITVIMNNPETGMLTHQPCHLFRQDWIEKGIYGRYLYFINQDSVFWRKELWQKAGPINSELKLAGDYYLWVNMARYAPLYSLNAEVSCYRNISSSLGQKNMKRYRKEQEKVVPIKHSLLVSKIKLFYFGKSKIKHLIPPVVFDLIFKYIFPKVNVVYFDFDESGKIVEKHSYSFEVRK